MEKKFKELLNERFGMFVHYGIYSAIAGKWNGESTEGLGEWVQRRAQLPIADYEKFAKEHFLPAPDFAKQLVSKAKAAGVRYIVLTSKHHDGFCLFKSAVDGYNSYDYYGRDICKELADECHKQGVKLGFYYSHTLDWHEKNGAGNVQRYTNGPADNRNFWDFPNDDIDFEQYFRDKCIPQVKEILSNYGPLELVWFDYPHDITHEQSVELRDIVKELQPDCLINSRIAHGLHDYISLGDNQIPLTATDSGIECLVTLNHTWGYREDDHDWKSPESIISIFARTLACNSTLLLNVGPMGNGYFTPETDDILAKIGEWTKENSDAIYGGVVGNPFSEVFDFGQVSTKDNKIFFYVNGQENAQISVSGLLSKPEKVYLLKDKREVDFDYSDTVLSFSRLDDDGSVPVYCAEFSSVPKIKEIITENRDHLALNPSRAFKIRRSAPDAAPEKLSRIDYVDGKRYADSLAVCCLGTTFSWLSSDEVMLFDAEITQGGIYEAELVHAANIPSDWKIEFSLSVNGQSAKVGEEKRRFAISKTGSANSMVVREIGRFELAKGIHRFTLEKLCDDYDLPIVEIRLVRVK